MSSRIMLFNSDHKIQFSSDDSVFWIFKVFQEPLAEAKLIFSCAWPLPEHFSYIFRLITFLIYIRNLCNCAFCYIHTFSASIFRWTFIFVKFNNLNNSFCYRRAHINAVCEIKFLFFFSKVCTSKSRYTLFCREETIKLLIKLSSYFKKRWKQLSVKIIWFNTVG